MRITIVQQRVDWVDTLKFIGILSVILGHINFPLNGFIYTWHMPLFFMVSGFFIKFETSFKDFVVKNFKRLMIPYFIFSIIGLFMEMLKRYLLHREALDYVHEIKGIFIDMDFAGLCNTYAFVLWFLPALFFSRVFLYLIKNNIPSLLLQSFAVVFLFIGSFYIDLPFGLDSALNSLIFVYVGNIIFEKRLPNILVLLSFVVLVAIYLFGFNLNLDMASKAYSNKFLNVIWAVSFVYVLIFCIKSIRLNSKFIKIWGSNTMLLFILHPYTNNIAHIVVQKVLQSDYWLFKFIISMVLLSLMIFIKERNKNWLVFKYV
ncbi:acyltransferase family protein [Campylobacter concisus]|uniref:acyltransferase family protein n=1 Tax=Campylobacter concisus TaxID=199 RepID=UPI000CD83C41|nr:acyltransferase family protein [Campylobacter concisus]